jgi:hypothetical protein
MIEIDDRNNCGFIIHHLVVISSQEKCMPATLKIYESHPIMCVCVCVCVTNHRIILAQNFLSKVIIQRTINSRQAISIGMFIYA